MTNRFGQGALGGPALSDSSQDHIPVKAETIGPMAGRKRFPAERNKPRSTRVTGLLARRRPTTIVWRVVSIGIDAIEGMLRRGPRPHVSEEGREVLPALAHAYAAAAVAGVADVGRILAALFHAAPNLVLSAVRQPVRSIVRGGGFAAQTTARVSEPGQQRLLQHWFRRAAVTTTNPPTIATFQGNLDRDEASEPLSSQVDHQRILSLQGGLV